MIKTRMGQMCCGLDAMYGGTTTFDYNYGYPATVNSYPECTALVQEAAARCVGVPRSRLVQKTMGAEDFSFYLQQRPGCFWFVGAARRGEVRPHHKSVFDFDERALLVSATIFVELVHDLLL